jgi:hypothetical protein
MFVVFKCLLVGLITQNSEFMFSTNKMKQAIFKRYVKKNGYVAALLKNIL